MNHTGKNTRGFALIALGVWAFVLFGCLGLSVDAGRLFINKNEAQLFADAAAMDAAKDLDGTAKGIAAAKRSVAASLNKWDFSTQGVPSPSVEFATGTRPAQWVSNPSSAAGYTHVRVTVDLSQAMYFSAIAFTSKTQLVKAQAVAAQTTLRTVHQGLFPMAAAAAGNAAPHFGLTPGKKVELWYWGDEADENLRRRLTGDYQGPGDSVVVGQPVRTLTEAKPETAAFLLERAAQDSDTTSQSWMEYKTAGIGNGRRIVMMPVVNEETNEVRAIGQFLLTPPSAIYIGEAGLANVNHSGAGAPGGYQVRLLQ